MELTGRTYIFFAIALVFLTGTFKYYEDLEQNSDAPGQITTLAAAQQSCDANAIEVGEMRLGCQAQSDNSVRVRRTDTDVNTLLSGGAKFVSASR